MMHQILILLMIAAVSAPFARGGEDWWKSLGPPTRSEYAGGHVDDREKQTAEMLQFLGTEKFDAWKTHEDDLVKISYPDHALLRLEVNGGDDGIKVEGGVCTSVDNSFQRAYVLKAGDATYGVFLVKKASWLDDGICLCGPMVHHVYRVEDGCLARFSLLPGGAVKKAQVLGDKVRLMAFEWTHLSCPRPVYEEMVERMTLKVPSLWNEERLRSEVIRRYGMQGRAGWLHPGQDVQTADDIMASKSSAQDDSRSWTGLHENYPCRLETTFKEGKLVKLGPQGLERTGEEAVKGSIDWAEDRLEKLSEDSENQAEPGSAQVKELVETGLSLCEKGSSADWPRHTNLLGQLVRKFGIRDPRLAEVIVNHGKGSGVELEILVSQEYGEVDNWAVTQLQRMLTEAPSKTEPSSAWDDPETERASDAAALIRHLGEKGHPKTDETAGALFRSGEDAWLLAAIESSDHVGAGLAQEVIRGAMEKAMERQSGSLLEKIFDQLDSLTLPEPAEILAMIDKLPAGEVDSSWEREKTEAREVLGKMKSADNPPE